MLSYDSDEVLLISDPSIANTSRKRIHSYIEESERNSSVVIMKAPLFVEEGKIGRWLDGWID